MSFIELLLIAIGLSMDAFAVSICTGLRLKRTDLKKALLVGFYFGLFQAVMPLIGYMLASQFNEKIIAFDHWIAFGLLGIIGGKMIIDSFKKEGGPEIREQSLTEAAGCTKAGCPENECAENEKISLAPRKMLPLALATSIDALAVGVSFAFLRIAIMPAVITIGTVTLILSAIGVKMGCVFGFRFKGKAELTGGIILILIGTKILFEHLSIY